MIAAEQDVGVFPLAALCLLSENSRQEHRLPTAVLHRGFAPAISNTATGFGALGYDFRVGPRSTGKERDAETGLDYFGARYFSGAHGRFTSVDPSMLSVALRNPQSWNRYSYTLNNPLRYIDPNGELWTAAQGGAYSWVDNCEENTTCYTAVAAASKSDHSLVVYGSKDSGDIQTYFANKNGYVDLREVAFDSHVLLSRRAQPDFLYLSTTRRASLTLSSNITKSIQMTTSASLISDWKMAASFTPLTIMGAGSTFAI
jgi:RHS repeat-associated protein